MWLLRISLLLNVFGALLAYVSLVAHTSSESEEETESEDTKGCQKCREKHPTSQSHLDHRESMSAATMNAHTVQVVQQLPTAHGTGVLNPNTGFPEPFNHDRNTTLPHPSADTSENASIEAEDLQLTRTGSRIRFLHSRHASNKSITKGKLDPAHLAGEEVVYVEAPGAVTKPFRVLNGVGGVGKENGPGIEKEGKGEEKEEGGKVGDDHERDGQEGERKRGFLGKLGLHKV